MRQKWKWRKAQRITQVLCPSVHPETALKFADLRLFPSPGGQISRNGGSREAKLLQKERSAGIRGWAYSAKQVDRRPLLFNQEKGNGRLGTAERWYLQYFQRRNSTSSNKQYTLMYAALDIFCRFDGQRVSRLLRYDDLEFDLRRLQTPFGVVLL